VNLTFYFLYISFVNIYKNISKPYFFLIFLLFLISCTFTFLVWFYLFIYFPYLRFHCVVLLILCFCICSFCLKNELFVCEVFIFSFFVCVGFYVYFLNSLFFRFIFTKCGLFCTILERGFISKKTCFLSYRNIAI